MEKFNIFEKVKTPNGIGIIIKISDIYEED
jgi:hypothetical protein